MEEIIKIIVYGAVGSLLAVGIQKLAKLINTGLSARALKRFLNPMNSQVVIIHPVYHHISGSNELPSFARIEDIIAVYLLIELFKENNIRYKIQDETQQVPKHSDLLLICSPKGNNRSKAYRDNAALPFEFVFNESQPSVPYFIDKKSEVEYWSPIDRKGAQTDIGMIARITEKNPSRRVILFWGIHGVGTLGAVQFIMDFKNLKEIHKAIDEDDFGVLVEAPFDNPSEVGDAEMLTLPRRNQ